MYKAYLVDDEPLALKQLLRKPTFNECGFEIIGNTTDIETAIREIKALSPDVVFSDLEMPCIDGIQLMEKLIANGCRAEFVIMCVFTEISEVRRHFISSEFDYLVKPVNPQDLKAVLERVSDKVAHMPLKELFITPSTKLNEILSYLQEYLAMKHTLESIGEKWNLNPNTVCNLFAKHLNTTFTAYLTGLRVKHAEDLLKTTVKSIKEIAYLSGYNDYFYFCRVFKEAHDCTPTEFRTANSKSQQLLTKAVTARGLSR